MAYCKICDKEDCGIHRFPIGKVKKITEFSGSSPPEVFVGEWDYPNVYSGILSPEEYGDTKILSSPEEWHAKKLSIREILSNRQKLIYGRTKNNIKNLKNKFLGTMQEVAMTHKSIAAEFKLKKPITRNKENNSKVPLISKAGEVSSVRLQENAPVQPKIDSLINDDEVKSIQAIIELNKSRIETSTIIKLLSAGLLGLKQNRKLVPTKWAITATDDALSKEKLKRVRYYPEISEILLFNAEYLGNHYEFLLLPDKWSFEVIEISLKNLGAWQDYESFFPRKTYASDVTGAYYVNRLAVSEYLDKIKRQAQCLVIRQVSQEYSSPLGVGILRQTSREAFSKTPEKCSSLPEAFQKIQPRLKISVEEYLRRSFILKNYGRQKRLSQFF
jgi:hypothetical protein